MISVNDPRSLMRERDEKGTAMGVAAGHPVALRKGAWPWPGDQIMASGLPPHYSKGSQPWE